MSITPCDNGSLNTIDEVNPSEAKNTFVLNEA